MRLKIKQKREEMNMTQGQFSQFTGVPQQTISSLEIGARQPLLISALRVAIACGCTVEELVDDDELSALKTA